MTCRCGYEFCYTCGGKYKACECNFWLITVNLMKHYNYHQIYLIEIKLWHLLQVVNDHPLTPYPYFLYFFFFFFFFFFNLSCRLSISSPGCWASLCLLSLLFFLSLSMVFFINICSQVLLALRFSHLYLCMLCMSC